MSGSVDGAIYVNMKNIGILLVDCDLNKVYQHRGYPVKVTYKYLGIKINNEFSSLTGLDHTKKNQKFI